MEATQLLAVLGGIGTVAGIIFGWAQWKRAAAGDSRIEGESRGTIMSELGYIRSGVDDLKHRQNKQDEQHLEVVQRLSEVESSAKQAHLRIDRLEQKNNQ